MIEYDYVKTHRADVRPIKDAQVPIVRFIMRLATRLNVAVFRVSKGRRGVPSLRIGIDGARAGFGQGSGPLCSP